MFIISKSLSTYGVADDVVDESLPVDVSCGVTMVLGVEIGRQLSLLGLLKSDGLEVEICV